MKKVRVYKSNKPVYREAPWCVEGFDLIKAMWFPSWWAALLYVRVSLFNENFYFSGKELNVNYERARDLILEQGLDQQAIIRNGGEFSVA